MENTLCIDKGSPEQSTKQDSGIQMDSLPSQIASLASNDSTENGEEVSENEAASSERRRTYDQLSIGKPSNSGISAKMLRTEKGTGNFDQISDDVALQRKSENTEVRKVQMDIKQMDRSIACGGNANITNHNYYGGENKTEKSEEQKGSEEELAIEQVKQYQAEHKEKEVIYPNNIKVEETIPRVNPVMRKIPLHLAVVDDDTSYDPNYRNDADKGHGDRVKFDDLLKLLDSHKFIALVGRPGCGKTTCSKRLANSLRGRPRKFCIRLQLSQLGSSDRTLRELLLDKNYSDLDRKTCENAFDWVKKHQDDCTLILDGFDQLPWSFKDATVEQGSYDEPMSPRQLIANLCGKKFLPKIRLVLTSRSYALIPLPVDLRPDLTIRLQDLSTDDVETLFRFFCGDKDDNLWKKLNVEVPLLISLCHNPLMLNFLVSVIKSNRQSKMTEIRTMTAMFRTLLQQLRHSKHCHSPAFDPKELYEHLGSLAYRAIERSTLIFTVDDLKREHLELKDVQDLMFLVVDYAYESERLFETEDTKLYFVHQTWQEFFAAYFLSHCVDIKRFQSCIDDTIRENRNLMVKRFLCGLLTSPDGEEMKAKATMFFTALEEQFKNLSTNQWHTHLLDVVKVLPECGEKRTEIFAAHFPAKADFNHTELRPSTAHALGKMIGFVCVPIINLDLRNCYPNHESLKRICDGLAEMHRKHNQKIKVLNLSFNRFNSEVVETLCKVIPHVEERLLLCGAFEYENEMKQPNRTDLEQLITARDKCGNQKLRIYPVSSQYV